MRQVLVFTHDTVFLYLLRKYQAEREEEAKELEEKGDYFAFQISFPILAKRELNKSIKLEDSTVITVNDSSAHVIVAHSADYEKCVNDFAATLESLGWQGRLSALDIEIYLHQGSEARWWKLKTGNGGAPDSAA